MIPKKKLITKFCILGFDGLTENEQNQWLINLITDDDFVKEYVKYQQFYKNKAVPVNEGYFKNNKNETRKSITA